MAQPVASGGRTAAVAGGEATAAATPSYAELRSRLLLALALVNHRRTHRGLSATDTATVHAALCGEWDAA